MFTDSRRLHGVSFNGSLHTDAETKKTKKNQPHFMFTNKQHDVT